MRLGGKSACAALLLLSVGARAARAQVENPAVVLGMRSPAPFRPDDAVEGTASLTSSLLSLALPGAGQYREGRSRAWAYLAIEVAAWTAHLAEQAQGRRYRTRYRDFAWTNARVHTGPREEGDWAFYETMSHWMRSGAYDRDGAQAGVQPELDPTTFNGAVWALAREIYFPPGSPVSEGDPAYTRALGYYEARAYGASFLWDWSSDPGGQTEYGHLIDRSDAGFRHATIALGAVFANHLVSAADAFLTGRGPEEPSHISVQPDLTNRGTRWTARIRIPVAR